MKSETLLKVEQLKTGRTEDDVNRLLTQFVDQADATVQLFAQCEIHPALHSYLSMEIIRQRIIDGFGDHHRDLYGPGNSAEFLMDSIFDEALDEIVDAFKPCLRSALTRDGDYHG